MRRGRCEKSANNPDLFVRACVEWRSKRDRAFTSGNPSLSPASSVLIGCARVQRQTSLTENLGDNLSEMGVGDVAVPGEMRKFGEALYGR